MAKAAVSGPRIGKIVTKTQLMNTAAVTSHPTRGASCHSPQATTATAATIPTTAERAARVRTDMNRGAPVGSGRMLVMIPPSHEATSGSRLSPQMSPHARAGHSRRGRSCRPPRRRSAGGTTTRPAYLRDLRRLMNVARNVRIGPEFDADGQLDSVGAAPFGPTRTTNRTHERLGAEGFGPAVVKHCFCDSRRTPLANGGSGAADLPTHAGGSDARPIP